MSAYKGVSFVRVTTESILEFICTAKERIIHAKPAFMTAEVEQVFEAATRGVECNLYMEEGDQAIRYGFGESRSILRYPKSVVS